MELLEKIIIVGLVLVPSLGWTVTSTAWAMPDVRLAIDESAAPGTMTVLGCEYRNYTNSSKQWRYCEGTFVYDGTGEAVRVRAYDRADPGDVYAARITAERDKTVQRDLKGVLAPLGEAFASLCVLGALLTGLMCFLPVETLWPFVSAACLVPAMGLVGWVASQIVSNT
ncbi:hypothetical protein AB0B89_25295 [Sphaerisporangium sp. NPDC049002]|uniref:hypothetical protein n=1 Tax=unclassified Sphaerisporangium TaxID=2630420 RepID=UPI0033F3401F